MGERQGLMNFVSNTIKHNKLYAILFIFIVAINLFALIGRPREKHTDSQPVGVEASVETAENALIPVGGQMPYRASSMFDEQDMRARQAKLKEIVMEKPLLGLFMGVLNLVIYFMIFIGIVLDVYLIARWRRKQPLNIRFVETSKPRWMVSDVVRVTLIFLSGSYLFLVAQGFVGRFFPVLNNENVQMVINTAVMNVVAIGVILFFVVKKYGHKPQAIGLTSVGCSGSIFYGIAGYIALIPVLLMIMTATFFITKWLHYKPSIQPIVQIFIEEKDSSVLWFSVVFAAVFGPIAEEIFFRGFMYAAVREKIGKVGGVLITSAIFSLLHVYIVGFFPIMVLGVFLTYIYEKTGSLIAPIAVHIIHNLGMVSLVFLVRSLGV